MEFSVKITIIHALVLVLTCAAVAQTDSRKIELTRFGFDIPKQHRPFSPSGHSWPRFSSNVQLSFLDAHRLAISFPVQNAAPGLSIRSDPKRGTHLFKTVFYDTQTGAVLEQRTWGNFEVMSRLIALPDGGFLVRGNQHVQLFSPETHAVAERDLPMGHAWPGDPYSVVYPSPDGDLLYVICPKLKNAQAVEVWNLKTLQTLGSFNLPYGLDQPAVSTEGIIYKPDPNKQELRVTNYKRSVLVQTKSEVSCISSSLTMVADSRIVVSSSCHSLVVIDKQGNLIADNNLGNKWLGQVMPAPEAKEFCAVEYKLKGGSAWLDLSLHMADPRLVCFTSSTVQQTYSTALPSKGYVFLTLAISPDRAKLAFFQDGSVKILGLT